MAIPSRNDYDYVIAGTGCAGLSLVMHLIHSGKFNDKQILLIDKQAKSKNDRTWCFWEKKAGLFDELVYRKWQQAWIHSDDYSKLMQLSPYTYKLIRGIDFYEYCFQAISRHPNITILRGEVEKMVSDKSETSVIVNSKRISCQYIFNSILFEKPVLRKNEYYLQQHFKGWVIKIPQPVFNRGEATLMDFRTSQEHGTAFVYLMPFSPTIALVEYTLFSEKLLDPARYDEGLRNYIQQFIFKGPYKVAEEEFGVIPMTNHRFPARQNNIVNIGTAGGQTKASSGYTFRFIQKNSAAIVRQLIQKGEPFVRNEYPRRFRFYDSILLSILQRKDYPGNLIFSELFKKNGTANVLQFLDNESSLSAELKIILSLPTRPFLRAAVRNFF